VQASPRSIIYGSSGLPISEVLRSPGQAIISGSLLREALAGVEAELALEDAGWISLTAAGGTNDLTDAKRILAVEKSRLYALTDPLGRQSIRLWTDYTFGTGMTWSAKDDGATKALEVYWNDPANAALLSASGQRKSSDILLIDGEIFFVLFLEPQGQATLRRVNALEITEFITDPDDAENVRFYKREWSTAQGQSRLAYYRSSNNLKNEAALDSYSKSVQSGEDGIMFHLAINTIGQRGLPLLLPALDWIKLYRQFLAARAAIMLALARFSWKTKVAGGVAAVAAAKAVFQGQLPASASVLTENMGSETTPIKTDSQSRNAYEDARMLRLQVCAAVGVSEQYFGDISSGNLATAKTTELPLEKQFESHQAIWSDQYDEIDQLVLAKASIPVERRYVDRDFPAITPEDASQVAEAIAQILPVLPELAASREVMQVALLAIGVDDTNEVLDQLMAEAKGDPAAAMIRALRLFREAVPVGNGHRG